ncbi:hydrogenase [candidate division GN15 bacterium]|nr:hydrogenase [candidate division GN15 bacterium]
MSLTETLQTGAGAWNPLAWLLVFVVTVLLSYAIRLAGEKKYRKDTDQTRPFLSGNQVPDGHHIRAGNLYWGFLEAMKGYYERLVPLHTGVPSDYALWFFGVMCIMFLIGMIT